jgi:hypothetical protein
LAVKDSEQVGQIILMKGDRTYQEGGQLSLMSFFAHHSFNLRFRYGESPKPPTRKTCYEGSV